MSATSATRRPGRQRVSTSDHFHGIVDRSIRRAGGPGSLGQLRVRLSAPPDADAVAAAWACAGEHLWPLAARHRSGLRGPRWRIEGPAALRLGQGGGLAALAQAELRAGLGDDGAQARLALARDPRDPGVVLTWSHRLLDARGAQWLLALLADPARIAAEPWWMPGYREPVELPEQAAERGRLARACVPLLQPHRDAALLRPAPRGNRAAPLAVWSCALGEADTARADARQRAASGRLAETPFLIAAVASALEGRLGVGGDLLFPLAVDQRKPGELRLVANCHAFMLVRLRAGQASADLGAAARAVRDEHRGWLAADGARKLAAALSWFPFVGYRLAQAQLGFDRAGLAASCLIASTGRTLLPERWFDVEVLGVDHAAAVPPQPGLAVLFHRDRRGLCFDVVVAGRAARRLPPAELGAGVRAALLETPFPGPP